MSTLSSAKLSSLRDKHLEQEKQEILEIEKAKLDAEEAKLKVEVNKKPRKKK